MPAKWTKEQARQFGAQGRATQRQQRAEAKLAAAALRRAREHFPTATTNTLQELITRNLQSLQQSMGNARGERLAATIETLLRMERSLTRGNAAPSTGEPPAPGTGTPAQGPATPLE